MKKNSRYDKELRSSKNTPHYLDSMARFFNSCLSSECTAVAYYNNKLLVACNVEGNVKEESREIVETLTDALRTQGWGSDVYSLLSYVRLKFFKINHDKFSIMSSKHADKILPPDLALYKTYRQMTDKINAYQALSSCTMKKGNNKTKTLEWIKKDSTLKDITQRFSEDQNLSLSNFDLKPNKAEEIETPVYNIIEKWKKQDFVPAYTQKKYDKYIQCWVATAHSFRKLAYSLEQRLKPNSSKPDPDFELYSDIKWLNIFSRPVIDLERINTLSSPLSTIQEKLAVSRAMYQGDIEFIMAKYNTHAEMAILDRVYKEMRFHNKLYIGITKLCCAGCNAVINHFHEVVPHAIIETKGFHSRPYGGSWTPPEFLRLYPDVLFKIVEEALSISARFVDSCSDTQTYEFGDLSIDDLSDEKIRASESSGDRDEIKTEDKVEYGLDQIDQIIEALNKKIAPNQTSERQNLTKTKVEEIGRALKDIKSKADPNDPFLKKIIIGVNNLINEDITFRSVDNFFKNQLINKLNKLINSSKKENPDKAFYVKEILYDNELLNHPEMFSKLANVYGANKVLDLSSQMSPELLHAAIEPGNLELLGSILSLD